MTEQVTISVRVKICKGAVNSVETVASSWVTLLVLKVLFMVQKLLRAKLIIILSVMCRCFCSVTLHSALTPVCPPTWSHPLALWSSVRFSFLVKAAGQHGGHWGPLVDNKLELKVHTIQPNLRICRILLQTFPLSYITTSALTADTVFTHVSDNGVLPSTGHALILPLIMLHCDKVIVQQIDTALH